MLIASGENQGHQQLKMGLKGLQIRGFYGGKVQYTREKAREMQERWLAICPVHAKKHSHVSILQAI